MYSKKINETGGNALTYSITQDIIGNGCGFHLTNTVMDIEMRDTSYNDSELSRITQNWTLDEWNTF